ncbi:hypothetical protein C6P45_004617 [Maudiozyma exigua]|uniref:Uncharacterized protein n=1 Tax=Maudiozyma exigua TaxID=34358 RepID=A0A9P6WAK4_MAUEX|nr:hypothetical protein C6P45_004617 [Kazachstania exigua]
MSDTNKFQRKRCLSRTMLNSEKPIVYSLISDSSYYNEDLNGNDTGIYPRYKMFSVTVSQSQGFLWNQDLFASQYQQNHKVEYDSMAQSINNDSSKIIQRRMSDNCISFKNESQNGVIVMTQVDEIDIDSDTPENQYLKSLLE